MGINRTLADRITLSETLAVAATNLIGSSKLESLRFRLSNVQDVTGFACHFDFFFVRAIVLTMDSNNHPKDDEEFSFFDVGETENESQFDDLWLLLGTGERIYLGYPDDLCRQCYQREGFNYVSIGECRFLVCDDCERRNFPMVSQLTWLIH